MSVDFSTKPGGDRQGSVKDNHSHLNDSYSLFRHFHHFSHHVYSLQWKFKHELKFSLSSETLTESYKTRISYYLLYRK